jgi:hypothetical protein
VAPVPALGSATHEPHLLRLRKTDNRTAKKAQLYIQATSGKSDRLFPYQSCLRFCYMKRGITALFVPSLTRQTTRRLRIMSKTQSPRAFFCTIARSKKRYSDTDTNGAASYWRRAEAGADPFSLYSMLAFVIFLVHIYNYCI